MFGSRDGHIQSTPVLEQLSQLKNYLTSQNNESDLVHNGPSLITTATDCTKDHVKIISLFKFRRKATYVALRVASNKGHNDDALVTSLVFVHSVDFQSFK